MKGVVGLFTTLGLILLAAIIVVRIVIIAG